MQDLALPSEHIDDATLPFSEGEVRAALAQVFPVARAAADAASLAAGIRAQRTAHREWHARIKTAAAVGRVTPALPVFDVAADSFAMYVWPELEYLALLAALNPDMARRVDAHRARIAALASVDRWAHDVRLFDDAAWRHVQQGIRRRLRKPDV